MNPARRAIILTVVLTFMAGIAGAFLGTNFLTPRGSQENALHTLLHRNLKLTVAQDREIAEEERRFAVVRTKLETDVHRANVALAGAIQTTKRDGPEVQRAIEGVHIALGAYQKETVSHIFRMRAVLTPEQAIVFDRSVAQALMQAPQ